MPNFRHGKNTVVLSNHYDLSPYLSSATDSNSVDTIETTTFGAEQRTYVVGHKDGSVSFEGMWDGTANAIDQLLSEALGSDAGSILTVATEGAVAGRRARLLEAKETSYEVSSPLTDVVAISAEVTADGGLAYGYLLAALKNANASFISTGIDNGIPTQNGCVAHIHVPANTRDGVSTIKVQHSLDNTTWVDLITFSNVATSTATSQRSTTTGTVQRYVRAIGTIGGGAGTITLTVALARR